MKMKPDFSIIVPAYNEEKYIAKTLEAIKPLFEHERLNGELVVVDNNSSDSTAGIAAGFAAKIVFAEHRQIAFARNAGAAAASGRFLFFIDADTSVDKALFLKALQELESEKVVGGGAKVNFDQTPVGLARFLLRLWQFFSKTLKLAAGCFIFCRADAFKAIGGFDTRLYASEELRLSQRLKNFGRKSAQKFIILDRPGLVTSSRKNRETALLLATMAVFAIFPLAVRFRRLCFLWYSCRKNP